jgi:hypothetical protein
MMEPSAPGAGTFMDNIGALRAMVAPRQRYGNGAWLDESTAGTVTVGEGGAGVIRRARSYIAEESGKTYGAILPLKKDDATGDLSLAIPGFARDSATGILDMLEGRMTPEASMALLDIPIGGLLHAGLSGARQTPETLAALRAYHGSPHIYKAERRIRLPDGTEQFIEGGVGKLPDVPEGATVLKDYPAGRMRSDKIGTGEGNQAFSYGLYNAENEGVAAGYKARLAPNSTKPKPLQDAKKKTAEMWRKRANEARSDYEAIEDKWSPEASRASQEMRFAEGQAAYFEPEAATGALYTTKIDVEADDLLDWDAPLSEQSAKVRAALAAYVADMRDQFVRDASSWGKPSAAEMTDYRRQADEVIARMSGRQIIERLEVAAGKNDRGQMVRTSRESAPIVSQRLREAGIPGIRYLDQGSRGAGEGTRNFVIFDDSLIDIEAVDGKAVGLDMGQDARMARAKEMGFDTDTPLFHGTDRDITEFRVSKGGEIGPGVYVTRDATQAGEYARPSYGGPYPEGANVTKTVVKGKMKNMERGEWVALRGEIMDRLREENGGEWDSKFVKQAEKEIMAELEGEGFVGIYLKNPTGKASLMYDQGVVFDPANIRSVHAAFDPAKKKSADLLAASAGGGVAASAVTTAASDRKDRKNKP